jgi:hypothetical protein
MTVDKVKDIAFEKIVTELEAQGIHFDSEQKEIVADAIDDAVDKAYSMGSRN